METNTATLARSLSVIQAPSAQFLDEQLPDQQRTSPPSPAPGPTARSRSSKLSSSAAARNPAAGVLSREAAEIALCESEPRRPRKRPSSLATPQTSRLCRQKFGEAELM